MPEIRAIKTSSDYDTALARIDALMDAEHGSPAGEELDILATLVEAYEDKTFPMDLPDAVAAIEFVMEQRGYAQSDLAELIGKNRASEILRRRRTLSMRQARVLYEQWGIPAEALLNEPRVD